MKHILWIVILLTVFAFIKRDRVSTGPYIYDEADYVYAASLGIAANAFDSPSRSLWDFVQLGWSALRHKSGSTSLSQVARTGVDVNFYRHTHGPIYAYWLRVSGIWAYNEAAMRYSTLVFPVLAALVIYFGCLWILPAPRAMAAAVLSSALFLWSPATVSLGEIAPHLAFALCVLISLFCATKALAGGTRTHWYAAVAAGALALATLEVAFVLVAALMAIAWIERNHLRLDRDLALRSLTIFVATALIVWPAAVLKLAFVKAYLFMAYLAIARKSAWGDFTLADTWRVRLISSPVEWLLIVAAVLIWLRFGRKDRQAWPFLLFAVLMMLAVLRVKSDSLRYSLPFQPGLQVFTGIVLAGILAPLRTSVRWASVALCLACLGANVARFVATHPLESDLRTPAMLAAVRSQGLENKRLLVPQSDLPSLHYYFPEAKLQGFANEAASPEELRAAEYDALLLSGNTRFVILRLQPGL